MKGREVRPLRGDFRLQEFELKPSEKQNVEFVYREFMAEPFRGDAQVTIRVLDRLGRPANGQRFQVNYSDGNYGKVAVATGMLENGAIALAKLKATDDMEHPAHYMISIEDRYIGGFIVRSNPKAQELEFQLIPNVGDKAPDFNGLDVFTEKAFHLADLKGKVVLLEFWSTGCGPCQPAVAELNRIARERSDGWDDRVVLVAVSLDQDRTIAKDHLERRGWTSIRNVWSGIAQAASLENGFDGRNRIGGEFLVHGIPTTVLVDQEGTIRFRGNPTDLNIAPKIDELLRR